MSTVYLTQMSYYRLLLNKRDAKRTLFFFLLLCIDINGEILCFKDCTPLARLRCTRRHPSYPKI